MSPYPEDERSVERDVSETRAESVGKLVRRRSFLGGLTVAGVTGLMGSGAVQEDGQNRIGFRALVERQSAE